jgi:hypothetical protein
MKMVKKILLGMALTAAVISFVSCGVKQDEEKAFNGENIEMTHNGKSSDKGTYYRSFASTKTKHYSANAKISIENADSLTTFDENVKVESKAGLGFVFGLEEVAKDSNVVKYVYDEDFNAETKSDGSKKTEKVKFYDFGVASVRWNAKTNKAQWYVSWCKNVPDSVFNYNPNGAFADTALEKMPENAEATIPVAHEDEIVKGTSGAWKDIAALELAEDGSFNAMIQTKANEDGSYTVNLCKIDDPDTVIDTTTIAAAKTGLTEKTQKLIGRYLTVYWKQTVKGKIEYEDISGNVIPADYDVVLE